MKFDGEVFLSASRDRSGGYRTTLLFDINNIGTSAAQLLSPSVDRTYLGHHFFIRARLQVVVNEIAPRPHNSGHYTIEACYTSQFENHVRAVLGLPLGDCSMKVCAGMQTGICVCVFLFLFFRFFWGGGGF